MKWTILSYFLIVACVMEEIMMQDYDERNVNQGNDGETPCDDGNDCEVDECCVATHVGQIIERGVCQKLGRTGTQCNEEDAKLDYYGKYLKKCPCKAGLDCEPTGKYRNGAGTMSQTLQSQKCIRHA